MEKLAFFAPEDVGVKVIVNDVVPPAAMGDEGVLATNCGACGPVIEGAFNVSAEVPVLVTVKVTTLGVLIFTSLKL